MKKLNLILIVLFIFLNNIFAQNVGKNNEKYWYYRERLKWFMIGVGPNPGQSMPAASRDGYTASIFPTTDPLNTFPKVVDYYHDPSGNLVIDPVTNDTAKNYIHGLLSVNDNLNQLGWYIGVLATEWKLLHDEGSDTRNTEKELYYALYALRRLDNTDFCLQQNGDINPTGSNQHCVGNIPNDGFFLREDFPFSANPDDPSQDMVPSLTSKGNNKPHLFVVDHTNSFAHNGIHGDPNNHNKYGCNDSKYYTPGTAAICVPWSNCMSQDHGIRLMMGLSLVSALVDVNANYNGTAFQDGYTSFQGEARQIAFDMLQYFQHGDWLIFKPGYSPSGVSTVAMYATAYYSWVAVPAIAVMIASGIPPTQAIATYVLATNAPYAASAILNTTFGNLVPRGNTPMKYGYGFAQAGKKICGGTNQFLDFFTTTPEAVFMWKCNAFSTTTIIDHSNMNMSLLLACMGDSWNIGSQGTEIAINNIESNYNFDGHFYSLLWANLHNKTLNTSFTPITDVEGVLNTAPCEGPTSGSSNDWFHTNRFNFSAGAINPTPSKNDVGNNGLDYMLLYNLYYLYYRSQLPKYFTSWDNNSTNIWYRDHFDLQDPNHALTFPMTLPSSNGSDNYSQIGTTAHPLSIRAEDYIIDGTTQILAGADVTFRSGNSNVLQLTPGFYAAPGSNWDASKNLFQYSDCSPITGNYDRHATTTKDETEPIHISNFLSSSFTNDAFINIAPNPFSSNTIIQMYLPSAQANTTLTMYNMLGEQVKIIVNTTTLTEGIHQYDIIRENLPSGIYQLQLKTNNGIINKQVVIQ
ncbi:MAG: hypothetical protein RL708_1582 [Bacteroidota bacterium]|jgi:hypothetical protein